MAFTTQDLTAVNEAIASGAKQVTIGSQSVSYRSMAELLKARQTIMDELGVTEGADPPIRQYRTYFAGRGFSDCGDR